MNSRSIVEAYNKGYRPTKEGKVLNPRGKEVGYIGVGGYPQFKISYEGKSFKIKCHRFQAFVKFGNKIFNKGVVVRHLDSNRLNFSISNIEIGTQKDNMADMCSVKMRQRNIGNSRSSIKYHNIDEIRDFYKNCRSYKETMSKFNISSKGTLYHILKERL